jgi:hypothetical protein
MLWGVPSLNRAVRKQKRRGAVQRRIAREKDVLVGRASRPSMVEQKMTGETPVPLLQLSPIGHSEHPQ